jgi:hypothetical protein
MARKIRKPKKENDVEGATALAVNICKQLETLMMPSFIASRHEPSVTCMVNLIHLMQEMTGGREDPEFVKNAFGELEGSIPISDIDSKIKEMLLKTRDSMFGLNDSGPWDLPSILDEVNELTFQAVGAAS